VLPAARDSRPFRLVIREYETYATKSSGGEQQRLVYADVIDLNGGGVVTPILPAIGSALDGYAGSDGSQHVNYVGTDGHIHELYIHLGNPWVDNNLTTLASATPPTIGSSLVGTWGSDGSQHVNYVGTDGHIHELYIHLGNPWVDNDLTALADAVLPSSSALDGYTGTDGSVHVNYVGTDGRIHELYIAPGRNWVDNDLTTLAGAATPATDSPLDGYFGSDGSQHVNYISTDGHIHELYIAPGRNWVDNDLTALANATPPKGGTPLDGYWDTNGSQHVNYIGTDGHIHELYIHLGNPWVDNDLTTLA
jgi:hypothetical protein